MLPMINAKTIGNKIAEARKKKNISQAQLAQQLFISSQAVGKWERGESMPDITTFNNLAEILGVDLNYFSENFQSGVTTVTPVESLDEQAGELPSAKPEKKLNWDMSRGNWVDADFSGLKELHEKFSGSNMQRCKFIGSDLSGLLLKGNYVDNCNFSGSNISSSQIQGSHLIYNKFNSSSLKETAFSTSHIKDCDFSDTDLTGAMFKSCSLQKSLVVNTVWNRTSFNATQLADIVINGKMEDCYFDNCAFTKVTFQNATLINTFFKNKSLKGIRFVDCEADRMTYEFLKNGKANLSGLTLLTP